MNSNNKKIEKIRHSLSHILAYAVDEMYSDVKFGIGPTIENGFYYDFDLSDNISKKDLPKIEEKMKELIKQNIEFERKEISKAKAKEIFKDQTYKLELIEGLEEGEVSIYKSGDFIDLCKGPHVDSTEKIDPEAFKLTSTAGAYWKGDEENKMLTRIYGVAFKNKDKLEEFLKKREEAKKREHSRLGKKLNFFIQDEEVGAGLPLWTPKGAKLIQLIKDHLRSELEKQGYDWVATPHIGKKKLWETSGHWEMYREDMYPPIEIDNEKYLLKPMNCPFHVKIFKSKLRSYRDLPIKYAEFGTVYRYEKSGTLHGLTRVRGFTQDDAHIWCKLDQLEEELEKLLKHGLKILGDFGFEEFDIYLSTRPEKFAGTKKIWNKATSSLKEALNSLDLDFEEDPGEGVFYGPKIDIKVKDNLGRQWQCTTIQLDFNLPERFDMNYINKEGDKTHPIMIHRALLGSLERFIGVLIEHYAGALPFWLSPTQVWILPIGEDHRDYAEEIKEKLEEEDIRVETKQQESISKRIRNSEVEKIPYSLVVGDQEIENETVNVRKRQEGQQGEMPLSEFIDKVKE